MDAFGVFQGGGLKGFAHVGALQAADEKGIRFRGLAGTSAGAIVAALAAAGYTGKELLDTLDGAQPGLLSFKLNAVLDPVEMRSAGLFGHTWRKLGRRRHPVIERLGRTLAARWVAQPLIYLWHERLFQRLRRHNGAMGLSTFTDWLDEALRAKLGLPGGTARVRFRDLPIPLRCVAANLSREDARVFGEVGDEDFPVADAVAASACYPFAFKPVVLDGVEYVDGGLVSTLQAWVFDKEREGLQEFVPTLGFRLLTPPPVPRSSAPSLLAFVGRLIRTTFAAARKLEERRIDDYYTVDLRAEAETLAFHELEQHRGPLVEAGKQDALAFLEREIGPRDPQEMERVLRVFSNAVKVDLGTSELVRAYVLLPSDDGKTARTLYSANMEEDADGRVTMAVEPYSPAYCLRAREPVMLRPGRSKSPARPWSERQEAALRRPTVEWVYALPVFRENSAWSDPNPQSRPAPVAALCFDCDAAIVDLLLVPSIEDRLASYAQLFSNQLRLGGMTHLLPDSATPDGPASAAWLPVPGSTQLFSGQRTLRRLVYDASMADLVKSAEQRVNALRKSRG